jgi:hypothetical protein
MKNCSELLIIYETEENEYARMVGVSSCICGISGADALGVARMWNPNLNVSILQRRVSARFRG